jgi:tetratricopeptide (TPR) repeat protein
MNAEPLPRGLPLHFERIRGFIDLDMMEDAWRELDAVPLNARDHPSYRWLRITACLGLDKHFEATKITAEICSEYPEHEENWLFLANLLVKVGFLDLAIETLERAQEQNDSPDIRYELAANLCASGKIEEARDKLEALLAVQPLHRDKAEDDPRFAPIADLFLEDDE